jgi:hypothetical protein
MFGTRFSNQGSSAPCFILVACALLAPAAGGQSTDVPLISGGGGFVTITNGGNTSYIPVVSPVLAAPIGKYLMVESRATILTSFFPRPGEGYDHNSFLGLDYLQADVFAHRHLTVVAGQYLTPFGTYNERLTPIWIGNFESAPLLLGLGTGTGHSVGGMLRGSALSTSTLNLDYTAWFSAASTNEQFNAQRTAGGRGSLYFPAARLEAGASYERYLQDTHENFGGVHLWWEPADSALRLRSEFATGENARGYWVEAGYRLNRFGDEKRFLALLEPVFRMQQTFRSKPDPNDGLPSVDTQQADFGLDFHLPHEIRVNSSYSRQFSSNGNRNIWQTGITYRFLFPTWRSK